MNTTVCALLFGDYLHLAKRCIGSLLKVVPKTERQHLRVGLNAVGLPTKNYIQELVAAGELNATQLYWSEENIHKYPMIRRMVHGQSPVATDYLTWFDDDSYVTQPNNWIANIEQAMAKGADMLGTSHFYWFQGNQQQWMEDQPWYTGRPLKRDHRGRYQLPFCTGGWWTIRTSILYKYNWPWPDLDHRGGDVMLGQLLYQQGFNRVQYTKGVAINAALNGASHKSPRRGFDSHPIGYGYVRPVAGVAKPATAKVVTQVPTVTNRRTALLNLDL